MNPNLRKILSVAGTTLGGALVTYMSKALAEGMLPSDGAQWRTLGTGAIVACISALLHLWQTPPGMIAFPTATLGDVDAKGKE